MSQRISTKNRVRHHKTAAFFLYQHNIPESHVESEAYLRLTSRSMWKYREERFDLTTTFQAMQFKGIRWPLETRTKCIKYYLVLIVKGTKSSIIIEVLIESRTVKLSLINKSHEIEFAVNRFISFSISRL